MSSPAPSDSGDRSKRPLEQITFRFCSECSNMLYPKEDEAERKLLFTCRTCSYSEEATSSCIFRNVMNNAAGETAGVTQDVGSDPTVGATSPRPHHTSTPSSYLWCLCCGRVIPCQVCGKHYAVAPIRDALPPSGCPDEPTALDAMDISTPDSTNDDWADFSAQTEDFFEDFIDDLTYEDEDEAMGVDLVNRLPTERTTHKMESSSRYTAHI